jgi:putative transposase
MNQVMIDHLLQFIPQNKEKSKIGRPKINIINVLQGIFYLLKTGCQWNALPRCFGPSSTIHENFKVLIRDNVFAKAWYHGLEKYDRYVGLALKQQSFDCIHIKSPLGGELTGKSPVDRKKLGTKRSMLTDKNGIPLSITIVSGNSHDSTTLISTLEKFQYQNQPPFKIIELDAAFDASSIKKRLKDLKYDFRISPNKRRQKFSKQQVIHKFCWAVERTHSWINRFRRLLVRWEKLLSTHLSLIQFACCIIVLRKF